MSERTPGPSPWEPERYELSSAPVYHFGLDRRDFFKFLGAGVLVVSILKTTATPQESGKVRTGKGDSLPQEIDAWLHIGENGRVTVFTGKAEVGQNIRTSLSQGVPRNFTFRWKRLTWSWETRSSLLLTWAPSEAGQHPL